MRIEEAILIMENTLHDAENKSAEKYATRFVNLLKELELKEMTASQRLLLENELETVFEGAAPAGEDSKQIKRRFNGLTSFLQKKLFLYPDGHYMLTGMGWGMGAGLLLLSFLISYSDSPFRFYSPMAGMMIGLLVGIFLDAEVKKQNRMLKTRLY